MKKTTVLVSYPGERFIWLDGYITTLVATKFKRLLSELNKTSDSPIFVYVRGIGGNLAAAVDIIESIEKSPNPVSTIAHGSVRSACLLIAQSGHFRLAMAGTKFHFHPAAHVKDKYIDQIEQYELRKMLLDCYLADAIQLGIIFKRSISYIEVASLFRDAAVLGVPTVKRLGLVDSYYKKSDYNRDRKIARKLAKALK